MTPQEKATAKSASRKTSDEIFFAINAVLGECKAAEEFIFRMRPSFRPGPPWPNGICDLPCTLIIEGKPTELTIKQMIAVFIGAAGGWKWQGKINLKARTDCDDSRAIECLCDLTNEGFVEWPE